VKIAAIILAILLWFHVATEKRYQNTIVLPITQFDITDDLVLTEPPPDSVEVVVSARGKTLLRTDWKKRGLKLIVNRIRPGRYPVEISTDNLTLADGENVELVEVIGPREIIITSDRKGTREVPVVSRIVVSPDEGYAVGKQDSIVPGLVLIEGPNNLVKSIDKIVTEEEYIDGVRSDFTKTAALAPPQSYGLSITPDSVTIHFDVVPVKRKELSDLPIKLIHAPRESGLGIVPDRINLHVAGRAIDIDTLSGQFISAVADYVLLKNNNIIPVQIILPPSLSLVYQSVDSVRVIKKP